MTPITVDPTAGLLARLWCALQAVQEHHARRVISTHIGLVAQARGHGAAPWPWDESRAHATPDRTWSAVLAGTTCEAGLTR